MTTVRMKYNNNSACLIPARVLIPTSQHHNRLQVDDSNSNRKFETYDVMVVFASNDYNFSPDFESRV